jgi:PTS system fructose-specific IIC component
LFGEWLSGLGWDPTPLFSVAVIFVVGFASGRLANRLGLPAVTGNIVAGVILGPSVLALFPENLVRETLRPIAIFAMGLITLVVGGHLSYRRLHNALRRILWITVLEVGLTFGLVITAARLLGAEWNVALILAAISTATAPATVVAVVRETRSKGLFVKTALAAVALDNVLCIFLFVLAMTVARDTAQAGHLTWLWVTIGDPLWQLGGGTGLGLLIGWAALFFTRRYGLSRFTAVFAAVLLGTGVAQFAGLSPLLVCLALGIFFGNSGRTAESFVDALESLEPVLLTCFFVLAGLDLNLTKLYEMGAVGLGSLGLAYFVARVFGKSLGSFLGAVGGGSPKRVRAAIGLSLLPQAGLAIGLVVLIQGDRFIPSAVAQVITTVVLATVVLNELVGPPCVRRALQKSNEVNKDRRRLIEFLQEEHILCCIEAADKWDAIEQLADFLVRTHRSEHISKQQLLRTIKEREKQSSTGIGEGVAIPHGIVPKGPEIQGVLGILNNGIDFDSPDGQPVRLIALIVTPEEHRDMHLQVIATLARMMSDEAIRARLFNARDAAEAYEAIESEETPHYNDFLED